MNLLDAVRDFIDKSEHIRIAGEAGAEAGNKYPNEAKYSMFRQLLLTEKDKVTRAYMEAYCTCYMNNSFGEDKRHY